MADQITQAEGDGAPPALKTKADLEKAWCAQGRAISERDALLGQMADALRRVMTGGYSNMPQKAYREAHAALAAYDAMVEK